jgi:valyl-tRNA synthetase
MSDGQRQQHRDETTPTDGLEGEYDPEAVETRWQQYWLDNEIYAYDDSIEDPNTVYSIDTPPPTVSGDLHMGHLYGHTLQDFAARYQRMAREGAYFPFGYDDNGIASERLTERELGIRHQDYSRREFQEKCREVCQEYEADFTEQMQSLGMSMDWSNTYKTIEPRVQRLSQLSFLDLYEQGREYRKRAPAIWCPDCETAISQVEMEDAERDSHFNDIAFELVEPGSEPPANPAADEDREYPVPTEAGDDIVISTTRPELIPACVAMFVHPEDETNAHLVGGTAKVPLFEHEVPIYEDERVDREKGTGVVMCCTFGDQTDIEWYQAHDLDLRVAIDESATMTDLAGDYEGLSTHEAREAIAEDLDDEGLLHDRWAISHSVQVHERCEVDVEFRVTEQWYVELLDKKEEYLEAGRALEWYPEKMFSRYEHWIEGLEWDWCISRQRDSGIPFPIWYCGDCGEEILADRDRLPVEPIEDEPRIDACPECGSDTFEPEKDVFDTWATSSLTPLINAGWDWDADEAAFTFDDPELYPMDMRPQGHDIISFWLFHTIVKCYEHTGEVPFDSVLINGHVLDEHRQKMSKSKGNVIPPEEVIEEYPVDAIRFWAASSAVGDDFPYKEGDLEAGERLLRKLWNASKLVEQLAPQPVDQPEELAPIDEWLLARQDAVVESVTDHLDDHEFSKARTELRTFFWNTFCDDYLEIAKQAIDDEGRASTAYALRTAHRRFLELFAPLLPFITEEIWQTMHAGGSEQASLHTVDWPEPTDYEADLEAGQRALDVISALRKYKSSEQLALNADLDRVAIYGDVTGFEDAIRETMHVDTLDTLEERPEIATEIDEISLDYATLGPEYGEQIGAFDDALETGEYELTDDGLELAGEVLSPELYEVREQRRYQGTGDMIDAEDAIVIVDRS